MYVYTALSALPVGEAEAEIGAVDMRSGSGLCDRVGRRTVAVSAERLLRHAGQSFAKYGAFKPVLNAGDLVAR
jgi:hypothetical protein